jgi:hypothetical protein
MRIFGVGNVGIGTGSSDSGQRLQVQGTTLLNGNVTFSSSTGMTWDATNGRLGIGTNAPSKLLSINGEAEATVLRGSTIYFRAGAGTDFYIKYDSGDFMTYRSFSLHRWQTFGTTYDTRMQLFSTGNLLLQNGGTFTDSGERLQVTGTMKVTGISYLSDSLAIGTTNTLSAGLRVAKSLTTFGIIQDGTVQSSVTGSAYGFINTIRTQAASFTLANYYNYYCEQATLGAGSTVTNQYGYYCANLTAATNNFAFYGNIASGSNRWNLYMNGTAANYMAGNLLLGSTTDSGERLQVTGNVKVTGDANISGFIFTSTSPNRPWLAAVNGFASPNSSGTALQINIDNSSGRTAAGFDFLIRSGTRDYTSGSVNVMSLNANFTPTSGTGVFTNFAINTVINQTGGANGITRGLYVNPTLTAAADFRAIETARGNVVFGNLPTSPVGLPTGAIWNNLGILTIV